MDCRWIRQAVSLQHIHIIVDSRRLVLSHNPQAKALVLVPTIALAGQQCTAFEKAGFGKSLSSSSLHAASDASHYGGGSSGFEHSCHRVDWFCSDRQVKPKLCVTSVIGVTGVGSEVVIGPTGESALTAGVVNVV